MAIDPACESLQPQRDFLAERGFTWEQWGNKRWFAGATREPFGLSRKRMYVSSNGTWIPLCGRWEGPQFPTAEIAFVYAELASWGAE